MKASKNISWIAVFFAILTVLILVGIVWKGYGLGYIPARHMENPDILLPILISVSAVGLLISLAFLAVSFSALELSDRNQALGLPEGSVRALIALLLIILFVVISIYLYGRLRSPVGSAIYKEYIGISEAQLDAIPEAEVISIRVRTEGEEKTFNVTRRIPPSEGSEASQRFAEQVLTTISTLVVSIAAFYFGVRSVEAARGIVTSTSIPVIRSISLTEGRLGDAAKDVEILGKNFDSPKTVKLVRGSDEIPIEEISASETRIRGKLAIPEKKPTKKYELVVVNKDGGEDRLADAFEVKDKVASAQDPQEPVDSDPSAQDPSAAQG